MTTPQRIDPSQERQDLESVLRRDIHLNTKLFSGLIGDESAVTRFQASAYHAVRANPKLLVADRLSLLMSLGEAASLGLDVNPQLGECWLIPRKRKDCGATLFVDFQCGYKGLMKLARRAGPVDFHVSVVRDGDVFAERGGTSPSLLHEPILEAPPEYDRDDAIQAAYAVAWVGGSTRPQFRVVRLAKLLEARSRSGNPRDRNTCSNVWTDHFEAMCLKVAVARLANLLPRTDDLRLAVSRDESREAGNDPGPIVEQLRDIVTAAQAEKERTSGLDSVLTLPMPSEGSDRQDPAPQDPE